MQFFFFFAGPGDRVDVGWGSAAPTIDPMTCLPASLCVATTQSAMAHAHRSVFGGLRPWMVQNVLCDVAPCASWRSSANLLKVGSRAALDRES